MDLSTGQVRRVVPFGYLCERPVFSPDSTMIAFYRAPLDILFIMGGGETNDAFGHRLCVVPVEGGEVQVLSPPANTIGTGYGNTNPPAWSPDGKRILFVAMYNDPNLVLPPVQVVVDSCEAGIEWQVDYPRYDPVSWGHSIAYAQDFTVGFYNNLGTANQVWRKNFNNGDLASMKSHFAAATDSAYADSVDIVMWAGHGPVENGPYMRFFVDLVGGVKQPADRLYWTDASWGENDVEWVVLNTCSFLNGTDAELKQMAKGVHLICGYVTTMEMIRDGGTYFSQKLREMSLKEAWFDQADEYQDPGRVARVFGATTCMGDSLGSTGPIPISRDPNEQSTYTHEDHVVVQ
jgi:hypothetical protein